MKNDFFIKIDVFRRIDDKNIVMYSCMQDLSNKKFSVQSADYFNDDDLSKRIDLFKHQFIELMLEENPVVRCLWHDSLQDAIDAFVVSFDT